MKCIRILPDTCASTRWPLSSATRNIALGNGSTTVPSTSIASSLVMIRDLVSLCRPGPYIGTVFGDGDGVLEMGGEAPVGGHRRPPILEHADLPGPHRDHRRDREYHARFEQ